MKEGAAHRGELVKRGIDLQEVRLEQHLQLLHVELAVAAAAVAVALQLAQRARRAPAASPVLGTRKKVCQNKRCGLNKTGV